MGPRRRGAGAAVRPGEDLEQVTVRILEVDAAPVVPRVDLAAVAAERVRPVCQMPLLHAGEDLVELDLAHEERVVLRRDVVGAGVLTGVHVVERGVSHAYAGERTQNR